MGLLKEHIWVKALRHAEQRGILDGKDAIKILHELTRKEGYNLPYNKETVDTTNPRLIGIDKYSFYRSVTGKIPRNRSIYHIDLATPFFGITYDLVRAAKRIFGDDLLVFAVSGGALTANITGIPVKVTRKEQLFNVELRPRVGIPPDLDIVLVVNEHPELEKRKKRFLKRIEKLEKKWGIPGFVDTSVPFIITPKDKEELAAYFNDLKPYAVFAGSPDKIKELLKTVPQSVLEKHKKEYARYIELYLQEPRTRIIKRVLDTIRLWKTDRKRFEQMKVSLRDIYHKTPELLSLIGEKKTSSWFDEAVVCSYTREKIPSEVIRLALARVLASVVAYGGRVYSDPSILKVRKYALRKLKRRERKH